MTWLTAIEYLRHKWPRICSTCRKHFFRSFPRSWLITGFVTRLTRRVPLAEQELPTLPEHLSSPPVFSGVRVTRSLVLYVCFVDHCLSFCTFSFGHSSIYGFWLLFWYLKNLLIKILPDSSLEFSCYSIFLSYSMWHWRYFVSTVPADLQNILIGTGLILSFMNHANHMVSLPVFVCAVVLTLRLFVYRSFFYLLEFYLFMLSTLVVRSNSTQHILHTRYKL